jgi:hypothetical protein
VRHDSVGAQQQPKRDDQENKREADRRVEVLLERGVDRQWPGPGSTSEGAGKHDRRANLAKGARPAPPIKFLSDPQSARQASPVGTVVHAE